jgi:hypothetical protein
MFDRLRQQSHEPQDGAPSETPAWAEEAAEPMATSPSLPRRFNSGGSGRRIPFISDLTPVQRFILALMLFLNVSVLGCFALLAFGRISF